jgi:hypothetical protein
MSSIEIGVRRTRGLRFITHLDIIKNASAEARNAASPLFVPIPQLSHAFSSGHTVSLKNVHVRPDALFGIEYPGPDFGFFALEYDRSSEDVEPTKSLMRASWLRKVLSYSAISAPPEPIYETYLKVPVLIVLCVFSDRTRMANVMDLVRRHAGDLNQFLFKAIPPVDPLLNAAPLSQLFTAPWQSVNGVVNLSNIDGRR